MMGAPRSNSSAADRMEASSSSNNAAIRRQNELRRPFPLRASAASAQNRMSERCSGAAAQAAAWSAACSRVSTAVPARPARFDSSARVVRWRICASSGRGDRRACSREPSAAIAASKIDMSPSGRLVDDASSGLSTM